MSASFVENAVLKKVNSIRTSSSIIRKRNEPNWGFRNLTDIETMEPFGLRALRPVKQFIAYLFSVYVGCHKHTPVFRIDGVIKYLGILDKMIPYIHYFFFNGK